MLISIILLLITFALIMIFVSLNVIDREILALAGAIVTFFILSFFEGANFTTITNLLFGSAADKYMNMHSLILILGLMIIVEICVQSGMFQFLSFRLIQMTKGKPIYLLLTFSMLGFFLTAIINDILTVVLLIPLTIMVCRILKLDPVPYVITEGIIIKVGASVLLISSIPNILVSAYLGLSFNAYFSEIGFLSIIIFINTLAVFLIFFRKKFPPPGGGIEMLLSFNVWEFIPNKSLTIKSIVVLISVIIGFVAIPARLVPPDMIALSGAIILLIICGKSAKDVFKKIDFKWVLYLIGIFIVTGGLNSVGLVSNLASSMSVISTNDVYATFLTSLWISAVISSVTDTVSTTRIFLPAINILTTTFSQTNKTYIYGGVIFGINWGNNLTPFGETMLLMNIAQQNKCTVKLISYFKIAFPLTILQLSAISIIFALILEPLLGILLVGIAIGIVFLAFIYLRYKDNVLKLKNNLKDKVRSKLHLIFKKMQNKI